MQRMDLKEQTANPHRHPWELSRADMALSLLKGNGRRTRYADVGSGDLYFARRLRRMTDEMVYAVDVNYSSAGNDDGIARCTAMGQVPAASIDCAILMDVLEHVEDDVALLHEVAGILSPAGQLLITVPAHSFLWSEHDVFLRHFRRYNRAQLLGVVRRAGFHPVETFHFFAIPFLARALTVGLSKVRFQRSDAGAVARWKFPPQHPITAAIRMLLNSDFRLSRMLGAGPLSGAGLSIALRCRRTSA